jgi:hypothetical protein
MIRRKVHGVTIRLDEQTGAMLIVLPRRPLTAAQLQEVRAEVRDAEVMQADLRQQLEVMAG